MKQRPRIYYSEAQKSLMWERWQQGDSLHAIARFFDRGHSSVQRILSETGAHVIGTRRDIAWCCGRSLDHFYRGITGAGTVNRKPRG